MRHGRAPCRCRSPASDNGQQLFVSDRPGSCRTERTGQTGELIHEPCRKHVLQPPFNPFGQLGARIDAHCRKGDDRLVAGNRLCLWRRGPSGGGQAGQFMDLESRAAHRRGLARSTACSRVDFEESLPGRPGASSASIRARTSGSWGGKHKRVDQRPEMQARTTNDQDRLSPRRSSSCMTRRP